MLVNQPTKAPTRKLMAMVIIGLLTGGANSALMAYLPAEAVTAIMEQFGPYIQVAIMAVVGYFTRNKAN